MIAKETFEPSDLVAALADHDVRHLLAAEASQPVSLDPAELIIMLAQHPEPRLQEALYE